MDVGDVVVVVVVVAAAAECVFLRGLRFRSLERLENRRHASLAPHNGTEVDAAARVAVVAGQNIGAAVLLPPS